VALSGDKKCPENILAWFKNKSMKNEESKIKKILTTEAIFDPYSVLGSDTINSATFSIWSSAFNNTFAPNPVMNGQLFQGNPASDTEFAGTDYGLLRSPTDMGTTPFSTAIPLSSFTIGGYSNWSFNADGLSYLSGRMALHDKARFSLMDTNYDVSPTNLTGGSAGQPHRVIVYTRNKVGTDNDPKLIITHEVSSSGAKPRRVIID
jgi:hypothetical protein